ncbi:MAG: RNA polymerase sigma factor [Bacteroidia bacterium]
MSGNSDKELIQLISNPKTEQIGFKRFYHLYAKRLYWHINDMLANHDDTNDVLQDVMVKSWKGLKNFRGDSSIYSWLYRIATNQCITFLKKKKNSKAVSIDSEENNLEESIEASHDVDTVKTLELLQAALETLPEKQKQVFSLRYYDELSYAQISHQLNTSVGALKASYHHAATKIEKFIKQHS